MPDKESDHPTGQTGRDLKQFWSDIRLRLWRFEGGVGGAGEGLGAAGICTTAAQLHHFKEKAS